MLNSAQAEDHSWIQSNDVKQTCEIQDGHAAEWKQQQVYTA